MSAPLPLAAEATHYRAYGIELACDFALPAVPPPLPEATAPVQVVSARLGSGTEIAARWSGGRPVHRTRLAGGIPLTIERGRDGDHLIRCGADRFHLSADLARLTCPAPRSPAAWQALLDWIPYSAAVLAGVQCVHAAAVIIDGAAIALAAGSGSGKSTLAAELVGRGAEFLCDDVLALSARDGQVVAFPGPPFAKLGSEPWVEPARRARQPAPVAAVVALERSAGGPPQPRVEPWSFIGLRRLAIGIPRPEDAEAERFAALADLARQASLLRLAAADTVGPAALAAALEGHLRQAGLP